MQKIKTKITEGGIHVDLLTLEVERPDDKYELAYLGRTLWKLLC
jgi:hypothetical protein